MEKTINMKFVSLWIALICIAIFVIQLISSGFTDNFMMTPLALEKPWQFFTSIFLHGSPSHLIYNLFALIMFGLILEGLIGSRRFLALYLISGVVANVVSYLIEPNINALGASGAIMAVMGVIAVLRPTMTVWTFNMPLPMFVVAIIWIAGSIMGIFGFGDQGIGHLAHLSGIVVGILYGSYIRLKYNKRRKKDIETKIIIDEDSIRHWEDWNMR